MKIILSYSPHPTSHRIKSLSSNGWEGAWLKTGIWDIDGRIENLTVPTGTCTTMFNVSLGSHCRGIQNIGAWNLPMSYVQGQSKLKERSAISSSIRWVRKSYPIALFTLTTCGQNKPEGSTQEYRQVRIYKCYSF
jgi:hypothetical protein